MGLKKGMTNNPAGRPPGKLNKLGGETRIYLSELIYQSRPKIKKSLQKLEKDDPYKYLMALEKIMNYVLPKMSEVDIKAQVEAEYSELEKLLESCPDDVIDKIIERITNLQSNKNEE